MAVRFDASGEHYSNGSPQTGSLHTFVFWGRIVAGAAEQGFMGYAQSTAVGTTGGVGVIRNGAGNVAVDVANIGATAGGVLATGTWYCFAFVRTSATAGTLYYGTSPGSLTTLAVSLSSATTAPVTLTIGNWTYNSWLNGNITNFKQWSAALTPAEIATELGQFEPVRTSGLIRRHDLVSPSTTDQSGNGNTLTGGAGTTTEAGPTALDGPTAKSGTDTATQSDTATVVIDVAVTGTDTSTGTDTGSVNVPLAATDTVSTTDDAALYQYLEVVIGGGGGSAAGGAPTVAHHVDVGGAAGTASGGAPTVAHHVDVAGAGGAAAGGTAFAGSTEPGGGHAIGSGGRMIVGKAGDAAGDYGIPARVRGPRARLMAQKVLSGEWVSRELPASDVEIMWGLGGATQISAVFRPEIKSLRDIGLEPWGTWIHLEEEGSIRGSALLTATEVGHDGTLPLDAIGPLGYAAKIPWRGQYSGVGVDPADIVRLIWAHIQGFPRGNLGLTVTGSTPRTVGTEARDVSLVTGAGEVVEFVAGPYMLNYWNNTMCGAEIEKLSTETPFDIVERSGWTSPAHTDIYHRLELTYPQRGSRRNDLRFAQGENILEVGQVVEPDDAYADTVYVQGKGEGIDSVRGEATVWVGERLRLPVVIADKTIDNTSRANAIAGEELAARLSALVEIPEIVVDTSHRNAPLGSFDVGDEILPRIRMPYVGNVRAWHRITAIRYRPATRRAALTLTRRGEFRG